jgi:hypothetical protein
VARVLVVPVAAIDKMHAENKGIPLGVLWQSIADRIKSSDFNERMETARKEMKPKLTAALARQLIAQGYEAQAADGTAGRVAGINVDESKMAPTDAVLRISFNEVGMYSARFSKDYVPRVNLSAYLVRGQTEDSLYNETLYYGADSSGEASWSLPANPDPHVNNRYDQIVSDRAETTITVINAMKSLDLCAPGDTTCAVESLVRLQVVRADMKAKGASTDQTDVIGLDAYIARASAAAGDAASLMNAVGAAAIGAIASNAGNATTKFEMAPAKFNYLFGNVTSGEHNSARSNQLALEMKRLGLSNDLSGQIILLEHFEKSSKPKVT